jgi:alpha-L-fucosidase
VSGHCLWPSKHTDYHVGTSSNTTDVVETFVDACRRCGLKTGLYYCSWDNHHKFGSVTPSMTKWDDAFATREYQDFQWAQLDELMDRYGPIDEWWIDIPGVLPRDYRHRLYDHIAQRQPDSVVILNHGISDGSALKVDYAWPTDVITIERCLPNNVTYKPPVISHTRYQPVREIEGKTYYLPAEVCDPIGRDWFCVEDDRPHSDAELLGMYLVTRSRGANLLLDVGPDKHGLIRAEDHAALMRLRKHLDRLGLAI